MVSSFLLFTCIGSDQNLWFWRAKKREREKSHSLPNEKKWKKRPQTKKVQQDIKVTAKAKGTETGRKGRMRQCWVFWQLVGIIKCFRRKTVLLEKVAWEKLYESRKKGWVKNGRTYINRKVTLSAFLRFLLRLQTWFDFTNFISNFYILPVGVL